MSPDVRRRMLRQVVGVLLLVGAGAALALGGVRRLDRASVDGAGGGSAEGPQYRIVVAIGQHDAGQVAAGGGYAYRGGVFARVPIDVLFADGFEAD